MKRIKLWSTISQEHEVYYFHNQGKCYRAEGQGEPAFRAMESVV